MVENNYFSCIIIGICAFNFCLTMAVLIFVLKLWLDVYHVRWLDVLEKINEEMREK